MFQSLKFPSFALVIAFKQRALVGPVPPVNRPALVSVEPASIAAKSDEVLLNTWVDTIFESVLQPMQILPAKLETGPSGAFGNE